MVTPTYGIQLGITYFGKLEYTFGIYMADIYKVKVRKMNTASVVVSIPVDSIFFLII